MPRELALPSVQFENNLTLDDIWIHSDNFMNFEELIFKFFNEKLINLKCYIIIMKKHGD